MGINPELILGIKPPQFATADPLEQYAKVATLQHLMQQGQIGQRAIADDDATRAAYQESGGDPATLRALLAGKGQYKAVQAFDKALLEKREKESTIGKNTSQAPNYSAETVNKATAQHRDQLANVNDPQAAAQWIASAYQDPVLKPLWERLGPPEAVAAKIPQDPAAFQQWKQQMALGQTKFIELNKPHVTTQNLGGTERMVATPGLGGAPTVLNETPRTVTPDAVMTDARVKAEGALSRGVTMRGQNMVDQRQREANGITADGQLTPEAEQMAQAIAAGKLAPLSSFALNKPGGRALMGRVMQINPEYSGKDFGTGAKAEKDFATGKAGNSVRSFNVAISHLDTLDQLADALNNKDTQLINKVGNYVATQTGKPAPVNFDAAKKIVADEIVKAIVGSGGGVADREEAARTISAANSPAQLKGVIGTYKELMKGQLGGLRQQYETSTGRKDFDRFLSANAQATEHAAPTPAPITAPVRIKGDDGYNALPKGAHYVGPDGVPRIK